MKVDELEPGMILFNVATGFKVLVETCDKESGTFGGLILGHNRHMEDKLENLETFYLKVGTFKNVSKGSGQPRQN